MIKELFFLSAEILLSRPIFTYGCNAGPDYVRLRIMSGYVKGAKDFEAILKRPRGG
jgi:hypothetical protein